MRYVRSGRYVQQSDALRPPLATANGAPSRPGTRSGAKETPPQLHEGVRRGPRRPGRRSCARPRTLARSLSAWPPRPSSKVSGSWPEILTGGETPRPRPGQASGTAWRACPAWRLSGLPGAPPSPVRIARSPGFGHAGEHERQVRTASAVHPAAGSLRGAERADGRLRGSAPAPGLGPTTRTSRPTTPMYC